MQKLKLKSIYKFRKSCSSSHTEHNKIGFAIFGFFYDFIWIYKLQAQHKRKRRIFFHNHPWKVFDFTKLPSLLTSRPSSTKTFTEVPSAAGEARRRRYGARAGKQVPWGCDWPHLWPNGSGSLAGAVAGEWWRRGRGSTAATAQNPAKGKAWLSNVRHGYPPCDLVKALEGLAGLGSKRRVELGGGAKPRAHLQLL
jgi:hypothetical protein